MNFAKFLRTPFLQNTSERLPICVDTEIHQHEPCYHASKHARLRHDWNLYPDSSIQNVWRNELATYPTKMYNLLAVFKFQLQLEIHFNGILIIYFSVFNSLWRRFLSYRNQSIDLQNKSDSGKTKKRPWQRWFPVNFVKFLKTPFLRNTSGRLLLQVGRHLFLKYMTW